MNELIHTLPAAGPAGLSPLDRFLRGRLVAQLAPLRAGRVTLQDASGSVTLGRRRLRPERECSGSQRRLLPCGGRKRQRRRGRGVHGWRLAAATTWSPWCACWCATATCSTAWRAAWHAWAAGCCAAGTPCAATPAPAAAATSPRTTTWAMTSSGCSSPRTSCTPRPAGAPARTRSRQPPRASWSASAAVYDSPPATDVLEIGTGWGGFALHAARHFGVPRHHHDHLRRAVHAGPGARGSRRPGRPDHRSAAGLPRAARPVRQARLDRDDRGDRRGVPAELLPATRPAAAPRGSCAAAGDHHRGPPLRAGAEVGGLHQAPRVPGQLHSLDPGHAQRQDGRQRPGADRT